MPAFLCDRVRIQTWNLLIRSQMLYSVELRSHNSDRKYRGFQIYPQALREIDPIFWKPASFLWWKTIRWHIVPSFPPS